MAKRTAYKYSGILKEPMSAARSKEEYQRRLQALALDCGVVQKPINWQTIALTLAERHVPGFRVGVSAAGRPKWQMGEDLATIMVMEEKIAKGHSIRGAAQLIARERRKGESWIALESRYRRFQKRTEKEFGAKLHRVRPNQFVWRAANSR
jgi:hypothetical protein